MAQCALISLLSRRERLTQQRIASGALSVFDNTSKVIAKITELLYNTLSVHQMTSDDIIGRFQTTGVRQFIFDYEGLAEPIIKLADTATGIQKGELDATWDGYDLHISTTSRHAAMVEWFAQRNLRSQASSGGAEAVDPRKLFSPEALRAQQIAFGFDAADLFEFCNGGHFSSKGFDSLRFLDPPRLDQRSQYLVRHLILNPSRLRTFYAPFFFDLGSRRRSPVDDFQVVINATARNWSYYYPFIGLGADSESPSHLVSSRGVLAMFFVALHTHKNSISTSLEAACRDEGRKEDAAEVSALIKVASLALEKEVCDIGAACGWLAATSESKRQCLPSSAKSPLSGE